MYYYVFPLPYASYAKENSIFSIKIAIFIGKNEYNHANIHTVVNGRKWQYRLRASDCGEKLESKISGIT